MRHLFILGFALIGMTGCNSKDQSDLKSDTGKLIESGSRSLGNATLAAKVQTALSLRKGVSLLGVSVQSEAGTVTLEGMVGSLKEKQLIAEIARETKGVEKVVDLIKVGK